MVDSPKVSIPTVALAALVPLLDKLRVEGVMTQHEGAMLMVVKNRLRGGKEAQ